MDPFDWAWNLLARADGTTLKVILLLVSLWTFAGYKGWWVWGWQAREAYAERDGWREIAQAQTARSEDVLSLLEQAVAALSARRGR